MNNLLAIGCSLCPEPSSAGGTDCWKSCTPDGGGGVDPGVKIINPILPLDLQVKSGSEYVISLFPVLIGWLLTIGSIAFFFMLLWGGIQWIMSGGDKGAVESARGRITNAVIGLVILFSSFAIATLVEAFTGVNILTIDIGPLKIQ